MMRKLRIGIIVILAVTMISGTAMAWDNKADKDLKISVGTFSLSNDIASDRLGSGLGIFLDKKIMSSVKSNITKDIGISIGYIKNSSTLQFPLAIGHADTDVTNIPLLLTTTFAKKGSKAYFGAGTGVMFTKMEFTLHTIANNIVPYGNSSDSDSNFCYKLSAGLKFGKEDKLFAEANYINGDSELNTGYMFSVGARF